MSDFVLEIIGCGSAIALAPVGTIDDAAARTLLDALDSLGADGSPLLELRLDRVTGCTDDALALLGGRVPLASLQAVNAQPAGAVNAS